MVRDNSFHWSLPCTPVARFVLGIIFVMFSGPSTTTAQILTGDQLGDGLSISVWNPHTQCPDVLIAIVLPYTTTSKTVSQTRSIFANGKNEPATIWYSMLGSSVRIMRTSGCSMETVNRWGASGTPPGWGCLWQNRRRIIHDARGFWT